MRGAWTAVVSALGAVCACGDVAAQAVPAAEAKQLDRVVVTGTRTAKPQLEVPASISLVTADDLVEKGATEAAEALRAVPGIFFRRSEDGDGFASFNIRGLSGNHGNDMTLALVDGIPFMSANEEVLFAEIPFAAVEQVEVVRGPTSALYGRGGLGGAINYVLRAPKREDALELGLTAGSYGYGKAWLDWNAKVGSDSALLLDAYSEHRDGWREHSERDVGNVFLKGETKLGDGQRLTYYVNAADSRQQVSSPIPLRADGSLVEVQGGRRGYNGYRPAAYDRDSQMAALRWNASLSDSLVLQTTLHYRQHGFDNHLNFYDSSATDFGRHVMGLNGFHAQGKTRAAFLEPQLTWTFGGHQLIAGLNYERVDLKESDRWTGEYGLDPDTFDFYFFRILVDYTSGRVVNRTSPLWTTREIYRGDSTNQFYAFYLQDDWRINERWSLLWGLRYDRFERDADIDSDLDFDGALDASRGLRDTSDHVSPKLALSYAISDGLRAYASYGEGFNSNFGAVWQWNPSQYARTQDIKPSVARSWELGLKGRAFGGAAEFSVAAYRFNLRDLLVFVPNPDGFGPVLATNADEFESRGFELSAALYLGADDRLRLNYTYTDAEWKRYSVGEVDYSGREPVGAPRQMASLDWRHAFSEAWTFNLGVERYGDYYYTLDNRFRGGGYSLVNAGLAWQPLRERGLTELRLGLTNALDREYYAMNGGAIPLTAFPGNPREATLSLRYRF